MTSPRKAIIAFEDGFYLEGEAIGKSGTTSGEGVFNTAITGYQEIITDPSYTDQIMIFTYPHIGNYGVNPHDDESTSARVSGFVAREICRFPSNWRSEEDLSSYLERQSIVGIHAVDTRALVLHIREKGAMRAVISSEETNPESLIRLAKTGPSMKGRELVSSVTTKERYRYQGDSQGALGRQFKVIAYDFGIKTNILRSLDRLGCEVIVVPASTSAEEVLAENPDGVFLSNGPGDPAAVGYAIETVRGLLGKTPIFGICLGHQLLSLALGLETFKLKFGHRGANHPVADLRTGKIEITSQNHGFAVKMDSRSFTKSLDSGLRPATPGQPILLLEKDTPSPVYVTHLNLNDYTVEGLSAPQARAFSVQYHPEAAPGPHDSAYLFGEFLGLMEKSHA